MGLFQKENTIESLVQDLKELHKTESGLWKLIYTNKDKIRYNVHQMSTFILELQSEFKKFHPDVTQMLKNEKIEKELIIKFQLLDKLLISQINLLSNINFSTTVEQLIDILNQGKTGSNSEISTLSSTILDTIQILEKYLNENKK